MPVDSRYNIFYEHQSGGLCRLHSLNGFFGRSEITPARFTEYIKMYDNYLLTRFNVSTSSSAFDLMNSDQTNLVSYILKKHKIHARYYALNTLYGKPLDTDVINAAYIFVYNASHIWGIRKKNGSHYKVDSIGGVTPININSLSSARGIGIMVPVPLKSEWYEKVRLISKILDSENIKNKTQLEQYLVKLHKNNDVLGDLEIPIGVAMSILETNMSDPPNPEFQPITNLITRYNTFISIFTKGNYNNINLILKYVPDIILDILGLV